MAGTLQTLLKHRLTHCCCHRTLIQVHECDSSEPCRCSPEDLYKYTLKSQLVFLLHVFLHTETQVTSDGELLLPKERKRPNFVLSLTVMFFSCRSYSENNAAGTKLHQSVVSIATQHAHPLRTAPLPVYRSQDHPVVLTSPIVPSFLPSTSFSMR